MEVIYYNPFVGIIIVASPTQPATSPTTSPGSTPSPAKASLWGVWGILPSTQYCAPWDPNWQNNPQFFGSFLIAGPLTDAELLSGYPAIAKRCVAPGGPAPTPLGPGYCVVFADGTTAPLVSGVTYPKPIVDIIPCPPPTSPPKPPPVPQPIQPAGCEGDVINVNICNWPQPQQPTQPTQPTPAQPTPTAPAPPVTVPGGSTCDQIDQWAASYQGQDPLGILQAAGVVDETGQFGWISTIRDQVDDWPIVGTGLAIIISAFGAVLALPITAWIAIQSAISSLACQNSGAIAQLANMRGPIVWMRRLLGIEAKQIETIIDHWENYICPVNVPNVVEADLARRTKDISQDEWRCWVRLNGLDEKVHEKVYQSHRIQLTPFELIQLWRRKEIQDDQISDLLYQAGMISTDDQIRLTKVTEFIPPVTDLLHFIVRGLADPNIVQGFHLLDEFDTLYQGQLQDWGEANGISRDTMEYYHAGHWIVPSPGQLFTMLQRLRPGNAPPGTDPNDWVTTSDDVNRALRENAYAPFWRSRLQAISYIPLGIRQLRKGYTEGSYQQTDAILKLQDLGYSQQTAIEYERVLALERRDFLRKHPTVKLYIDAAINRQNASQRLSAEGYQDQEITDVLDWAALQFLDQSREICVKGLKKRYECGEFDQGQIEQQLSGLDLDQDQVVILRVRWDCERKSCGKQVAASQLCSWADSGLIDSQEYFRRLKNVGYSDNDAVNIVAECNLKQDARVLAQRERAARQAASTLQRAADRKASADRRAVAEARRAARELRQLQRQAASDTARAARQAAAATARTQRIRDAMLRQAASQAGKIRVREAQLAKAAELWAEATGLSVPLAAGAVSQALVAVGTASGMPADTALRAVVMSASAAKRLGTIDLTQAALDIALAMQGYAAIASAAVCSPSSESCSTTPSTPDTSAPAATTDIASPADTLGGNGTVGRTSGT